MANKLQKLEEMFKIVNDGISKEEFVSSFEAVLKQVLAIEEKIVANNRKAVEELRGLTKTLGGELKSTSVANFTKVKDLFVTQISKALKEQENGMNFIYDKIRNLKSGKDADETKIIQNVLAQIKLPKQKEVILDTPEEIRNKLETLQNDERLDKNAVKGLEELIKELREAIEARPLGGQGGVLNVGVRFETPTGTIDEVNTIFYVNKAPKYIVVDGVSYFENNGYTRSGTAGRTLTLSVPPRGFIRSAY